MTTPETIGTAGPVLVLASDGNVILSRADNSARPGRNTPLDREEAVKLATLLLMAVVDR